MRVDRNRWDEKYKVEKNAPGEKANAFLRKHIRMLPKGQALDIATGEGRNAVFLAEHGFDVEAVDISKVGLRKARKLARAHRVKIKTYLADLDIYPIPKERYVLITDFYFLDRRLIPRIKKALKPGGRIVFETYLVGQRSLGMGGPRHSQYLLQPNELLRLFKDFRVLFYREGIFREDGSRKALASLIAEKV